MTEGWFRHVDDHVTLPVVRLSKNIGHAHQGSVGHLMHFKLVCHLLKRMRRKPGFDELCHLGQVRRALGSGHKAGVMGEVWLPNHRAQTLEQVLRRRGEHDPAPVLSLARPTRPGHVLQPASLAYHPLAAIQGDGVFQNAEGRLIQ